MFRLIICALLLALTSNSVAAAATCSGADPAITSVTVKNVTQEAGLNDYHIEGLVNNLGAAAQAKDLLQSVDIYMGTEKIDAKSIPPLAPGQSYTFSYVAQRSREAGPGTTRLRFVLTLHDHVGDASQDCSTSDDQNVVTF